MMTEKDLVNDALDHISSIISYYTNAVSKAENIELRSIFMQIRMQAEQAQEELNQFSKKQSDPGSSYRNHPYDHHESANNFISSQSNGILKHIDAHTNHALQASPGSARDGSRR